MYCVPHSAHPSWLNHTKIIWWETQVKKFPPCIHLPPPIISSFLGPNTPFSTPFSNTLSLCYSLNVRDQVSNPYKTKGKITVLYTLMFFFCDSRWENKIFWGEWWQEWPEFNLLLVSSWILICYYCSQISELLSYFLRNYLLSLCYDSVLESGDASTYT
jgi:hypothetical protein